MRWDAARIREVVADMRLRRGDTTTIEVKSAAGGLPAGLVTTVGAFANMPGGGTILLGIDERQGFALTGVADAAMLEAGLVSQARAKVAPVPRVHTSTVDVGGKLVVVAVVDPLRLEHRPAEVDGRAYLRQADGDYPMHEHELRMIEIEKSLGFAPQLYDTQPIDGLSLDDLVPQLLDRYLTNVRRGSPRLSERTDDEILRRTGVLHATGAISLAALYALGDYPQGYFPSLAATAAVRLPYVDGGARNKDLRDFTGPVPIMLDDLVDWCRRNLEEVRAYTPDGHMVVRPEIALPAVREILANALVHRDLGPSTLGTGKSIHVRLTPTHLMVQSPGGLRGVRLEQIESEEHAQAAVNQRLYSIAKHLETADGARVIEGEGGAIREVLAITAREGQRRPALIDTGVQFTALLWRPETQEVSSPVARPVNEGEVTEPAAGEQGTPAAPPVNAEPAGVLTKNEPRIVGALASHEVMSFEELRRESGLTDGMLRYALAVLVPSGRVQMEGGQGSRSTVYRLPR